MSVELLFYNHKLNEGAKYYVSWKDHGVYLFHSVPTKSDGSINKEEAKKNLVRVQVLTDAFA